MRPLIISHAACGGHAPENTLSGIRKAIELGAEAIEIDVQASEDGVPVLMHDLTVDRTTNGKGGVAVLSLKRLRELDAGGEPVPTLAEVLDLTKGRVLLVMEVKAPGIEQHIVRVVHQARALDDVMAWSFFPQAIEGMRREDPSIPCALLIAGDAMPRWRDMRARALKLGAQGVSVFCPAVEERVAEDCRRSGLALYTWTPDSKKEIARLAKLGVDGICSNFPDKVVDVLANPRPAARSSA
ncbi:MAG TPA: glycerophosphodiester phosphodiesterase family protein [Dehalococcoidia bacterium]|nr:glycerophosphodiester phosphodiesterase family protein [Dehalococcoidia bacterium]